MEELKRLVGLTLKCPHCFLALITQIGTHSQLMKKKGLYAELVRRQTMDTYWFIVQSCINIQCYKYSVTFHSQLARNSPPECKLPNTHTKITTAKNNVPATSEGYIGTMTSFACKRKEKDLQFGKLEHVPIIPEKTCKSEGSQVPLVWRFGKWRALHEPHDQVSLVFDKL